MSDQKKDRDAAHAIFLLVTHISRISMLLSLQAAGTAVSAEFPSSKYLK